MKRYLITLILLVLITPSVAFASWWNPFSWKIFSKSSEVKIEKVTISPSSNTTNTPVPIEPATAPKKVSPTIKEVENIDLKIEKCKAAKEIGSNNAIQKINQTTNDRLEEVFNSLNQQYENEAKKINDETNAKISGLTGDSITYYSQYYNGRASEKLQKLHKNQQTFWYSQKREIEGNKQKALDQINLLLSEEYTRCIGDI